MSILAQIKSIPLPNVPDGLQDPILIKHLEDLNVAIEMRFARLTEINLINSIKQVNNKALLPTVPTSGTTYNLQYDHGTGEITWV